jgi:glycosyltransferase involved in cell wall biosynthesis
MSIGRMAELADRHAPGGNEPALVEVRNGPGLESAAGLPSYVPRRMKQHGAHSGYDLLFRHMDLDPASSRWATRLADAIPVNLAWRLWQLRPQATAAAGLRAELGAMPWLVRGRGRVCHFIYGEDTFFWTPLWQRKGNHSVASFHYPPQLLAQRVNPGSIRSLHSAVILGDNQRAYFEDLLPAERIHYCPHAVDTVFFCPPGADEAEAVPQTPARLLCVGAMYRDFVALREVHRLVRRAGFAVQTDVVGATPDQRAQLEGEDGILLHNGISDEALRSLYRVATVGVLPLIDGVANNALLEMLACGVPIVTTRVGAVPQYCEGSAAWMVEPAEPRLLADAVCSLLAAPDERRRMAGANRQHACAVLALDVVAQRMQAIYRSCAPAAITG